MAFLKDTGYQTLTIMVQVAMNLMESFTGDALGVGLYYEMCIAMREVCSLFYLLLLKKHIMNEKD